MPAARIIRVLDRIAAWRGYPTKMRMDNGPEFVSVQLAGWAEQHGIDLEFIQPGKPTQNSYVERFNRTFRDEILNFYVFSRLSEVRTIVDAWVQEYNEQRPHGGEVLKEPSHAGGRGVSAPWPFLFWRIRSSERFGKSPGPDEVANCAVHRADFTNNRSNARSIKIYPTPIVVSCSPIFPVVPLSPCDSKAP